MIEVDKILNGMKEDLTNLRILESLIDMKVEDLIDGLKSGRLQIAQFTKINLSSEKCLSLEEKIKDVLKTKKCENCQSWATGTNFISDRCGLFGKKVTYNANTCKHYQERKFDNE